MMRVFIDPVTGISVCPAQEQYHGPDLTYQALGQFIGVDTEGIFVGRRDKQVLYKPDGTTQEVPQDLILIQESILKRIWFYYYNGIPVRPDEVTSAQMTLHFYYPPNYDSPYVQKSFQTDYTVMDRGELAAGSSGSSGSAPSAPGSSGLPTYDKRFGCIPANVSPPSDITTSTYTSPIINPYARARRRGR
jgi:hypothetical protein